MDTSEYLRRWKLDLENGEYDSALAIIDERLQTAVEENNADEISYYTNLKKYTHDIVKALTSHNERELVTLYCSMCGKGEGDGSSLVSGAQSVSCDGCIKICVGVVDTQRCTRGIEFECSFCGKKQSEVSTIIAGPGVSICDNCCKRCTEILAR